jgi:hypothetical protein
MDDIMDLECLADKIEARKPLDDEECEFLAGFLKRKGRPYSKSEVKAFNKKLAAQHVAIRQAFGDKTTAAVAEAKEKFKVSESSIYDYLKHPEFETIRSTIVEALRPFFPEVAIAEAVRNFVGAGGRHLKGVHIYQAKNTVEP